MSRFESVGLAAEETLDRVVCSREQFSFQMCLESGDGSGTFCNWRNRPKHKGIFATRIPTQFGVNSRHKIGSSL